MNRRDFIKASIGVCGAASLVNEALADTPPSIFPTKLPPSPPSIPLNEKIVISNLTGSSFEEKQLILHPGELCIVTGKAGRGKTTFCRDVIAANSQYENRIAEGATTVYQTGGFDYLVFSEDMAFFTPNYEFAPYLHLEEKEGVKDIKEWEHHYIATRTWKNIAMKQNQVIISTLPTNRPILACSQGPAEQEAIDTISDPGLSCGYIRSADFWIHLSPSGKRLVLKARRAW
jgi:hypothetical protein